VRKIWAGLAAVALLAAVGCVKSEVTEGDSNSVKKEFSQDNYDAAMKASGKTQELDEEKAKWAAYEQAGTTGSQQGQ
jgi:hypothetical protein